MVLLAQLAQVTLQGTNKPGHAAHTHSLPSILSCGLLRDRGHVIHQFIQCTSQSKKSLIERVGCSVERGAACRGEGSGIDTDAYAIALQVRTRHNRFVGHVAIQLLSQAIEGRLCRVNSLDNGEQYGIIGGYPQPALYVNDDIATSLGMVDGLQDTPQALLLHALLEGQCCRLF